MKILKKIYNIFDKLIITPISRIVYNIQNFFKSRNLSVEKMLNKPKVLIYVSLLLAVGVYLLINSKVVSLVETQAEILDNQKVNLIYNEEAYVIEGAPKTVDITLIGRSSDLYLAKQLGDNEVTLDLTGYGIGEHKVKLSYSQTIDSINYKLDPSYVMVIIKEKQSTIKSLTYDILNQDQLDPKLSIGKIELDRSEVVVKGSEETLKKVATVKALVDLNNEELKEAGTYTLENVKLVAYNEKGVVVKGVEVVPSTINAQITLESFSTELPLKINTTGSPASGTAISEINSNISNVKVYGDQETISTLKNIPVEIDIDNLNSDKTFNVTISKPNGIRYMSETAVTIEVKVGTESSKEISGIGIETRNIGDNLVANASSVDDTTATVIAKGVQSVLDSIDTSKISAYVDLTGYGVGNHNVAVVIQSDDPKVQFVSKVKTINIIISAK